MRALAAALFLLLSAGLAHAAESYLYTSAGDFAGVVTLARRPDIGGVQVVYSWRELEPDKDRYDFSAIERDLATVEGLGKKFFIQLQDRFFSPQARNIPDYLLTDPAFGGGLVPQSDNPGEGKPQASGWVAMQWNPALRVRYQKLIAALAATFDGRIQGLNLPETAIDIDHKRNGFSCDVYFEAELDNLKAARAAFQRSMVVQYVNFWPCEWNDDHRYMSRLFAFAQEHKIGLGGPDVIPWRKGQMKNAYPFFHTYRGKLPLVAMAVQEPTLTYVNPKTGKRFTKAEFEDFAVTYLGADIIFWSAASPWLRP
ncbi:hypothetical protein [Labrys neptuniae]